MCSDEGLEYVDDVYASGDADVVYIQDTTSLYGKHATITLPAARIKPPATTATPTAVVNLTLTKDFWIVLSCDLARPSQETAFRGWRLIISNTRARASSVRRAW